MVELTVVIVNYNVREYLKQCLSSLQKALENIDHEIIVVDNASDDDSVSMLQNEFPDVEIIVNEKNAGFAKANNIALKKARGRFVSLLNPDTVINKDTFEKILKGFQELPEAGMLGCKILNPDGSLQLACKRSFPTPWVALTKMTGLSRLFPKSKTFARYNLTYLSPDEINEVDAISGSFMTIRREVLENAGYLDERYFMYAEDLDWCFAIRQAGWKICYYPKTTITHYKGASSSKNRNRLEYFFDAMEKFVEKHFAGYSKMTPLWLIKMAIQMWAFSASFASWVRKVVNPSPPSQSEFTEASKAGEQPLTPHQK